MKPAVKVVVDGFYARFNRAASSYARFRVGVAFKVVKVCVRPFFVRAARKHECGIYSRAGMRRGPRVVYPLERVKKRIKPFYVGVFF